MKQLTRLSTVLFLGIFVVLVLVISGCGSFISIKNSKESRLESTVGNISNSSTNIGLLEVSNFGSKSLPVSIPKETYIKNIDQIVFWDKPLLKSQQWASEGWKNMKLGAVDGAKIGLGLGLVACVPSIIVGDLCQYNPKCQTKALLICGGALVGGPSAGLVAGGLLVPLVHPFLAEEKDLEDFSFVKKTVVQAIWDNLIKMGHVQQVNSLDENGRQVKNNDQYKAFEFGLSNRPFDRFIKIQPLEFKLIHSPYGTPEQLLLSVVFQLTLLDKDKKEVLIKEQIQIDEGPYTFAEWFDNEGFLLRAHIEETYQKLAERIFAKIQADSHSEPSKHGFM
ncbi:MAG: hypothetical protein K0U40_11235 [Betaproteobacteria bacterium]|nr:hypothetical protein [Betaproteobacteria bacterium]